MPVKVVESNLNVLQAAKIRIRNVFANGCKIYLSFSSGKDSLQPQQGQRGKPEAAYPVYPDQRLDTAHRGTP